MIQSTWLTRHPGSNYYRTIGLDICQIRCYILVWLSVVQCFRGRYRRYRPKESDRERLKLLVRILRDSASNVVVFKERAFVGSAEPDDLGLDQILPQHFSRLEKRARLRSALAGWLTSGGIPNRIVYDYDDGGDPETVYEFRFEFEQTRLYVKTKIEQDHTDDPVLVIISVKRKN